MVRRVFCQVFYNPRPRPSPSWGLWRTLNALVEPYFSEATERIWLIP